MNHPIRVLLADDHGLVRDALATWLDLTSDIRVIGRAESADDAVCRAIEENPDIVVLDIDMPGLRSFDAAALIQARCPSTRVLFLSAFCNDQYIEAALKVRAAGYITKTESAESITRAIREVASGAACFSADVQARMVIDTNGVRLGRSPHSRAATLTAQQLRILRYVAQGFSKKQIAGEMHLSERTVNRHCDNLMARLDIHDRVELTRFAIREGLIEA